MKTSFYLIALLPILACASTDWLTPCFNGTCSYTSPDGLGSVKIWGSSGAIADVTESAGWTILNCDSNALVQDVRLVCTGAQEQCDRLWSDTGASGKIVRLPETCGANAFARVSRNWTHDDQSLPASLASKFMKRTGVLPIVQGLALDTNFDDIDPTTNGPVYIEIQASNVPGTIGNSSVATRSLGGTIKKNLPAIDVDKTVTIIDEKISCPAEGNNPATEEAIKADVSGKAHAAVSLGVTAKGTIIPLKLTEFGLFATMDADLNGNLHLVASASGTLDSGKIPIFEAPIAGIEVPGILKVGPIFQVNAQAIGTLAVNADMDIALAWKVSDAQLFFPPGSGTSGGNFSPADTPFKLSASPSVQANGTLEAHIIPTLLLGVDALRGKAKANIFIDLDASAAVTLTLDASDTASTSTNDTTTASGSVSGCVDVGAGFSVNAGADAGFFGIFDQNTKVELFNKRFNLFEKCIGDTSNNGTESAPVRRAASNSKRMSKRPTFLQKRSLLSCLAAQTGLSSVVDEVVSGSSIQAV